MEEFFFSVYILTKQDRKTLTHSLGRKKGKYIYTKMASCYFFISELLSNLLKENLTAERHGKGSQQT